MLCNYYLQKVISHILLFFSILIYLHFELDGRFKFLREKYIIMIILHLIRILMQIKGHLANDLDFSINEKNIIL